MSNPNLLSRRAALKTTALASLAGMALQLPLSARAATNPRPPGLKLGLASYSLSNHSAEAAIVIAKQLQFENISPFKAHVPWGGDPEACRVAAKKFTDAGFNITGSGVVDLPNDEAVVRKAFESARAGGLPTLVCKPALDAFPLLDKFVKEYGIRLAIHNHGPEDKLYKSPLDAWKAVQPYDERIGLCLDVGHSARGGFDPVEVIRKCHARLFDIHLKDSLAMPGDLHDKPAIVGHGRLDIRGILVALKKVKYSYVVAFEYEKRGDDQLVGLAESVGFARGLLAGGA